VRLDYVHASAIFLAVFTATSIAFVVSCRPGREAAIAESCQRDASIIGQCDDDHLIATGTELCFSAAIQVRDGCLNRAREVPPSPGLCERAAWVTVATCESRLLKGMGLSP
jgi:hypothetical protein